MRLNSVGVISPGRIGSALARELAVIGDDWRGDQPERGFAMSFDSYFSLGDDDSVFVIGFDPDGAAQGFLHFAIAPAISALSLSSMPRLRSATPNGFNLQISYVTHDNRLALPNAVKPKN